MIEFLKTKDNRRGFTLLELMVAVSLSFIVVGAGFTIFLSTNRVHHSTSQTSLLQQTARAALDLMASEIVMAGFGTIKPSDVAELVDGEDEIVFPLVAGDESANTNSSSSADSLRFKASIGGMAILSDRTTCSGATDCVLDLHTRQLTDKLEVNEMVDVLDLDRNRLGRGQATVLNNTQMTISGYVPENDGSIPSGAIIIKRPFYITYRQIGSRLVRCVRDTHTDACDDTDPALLNAAPTPGNPETTYYLAEGLVDLQFSFLLRGETEFLPTLARPDLGFAGATGKETRNKIRAVKIEVLVRSTGKDPMITKKDCDRDLIRTVYWVGDRAHTVECGYNYAHMSTVIHLPNLDVSSI